MERREFLEMLARTGQAGVLLLVGGCGDLEGDPQVRDSAESLRVTSCGIHDCQGGFVNTPTESFCGVETCSGGFKCTQQHICWESHTGGSCTGVYIACGQDLASSGPRPSPEPERATEARRELAALLDLARRQG